MDEAEDMDEEEAVEEAESKEGQLRELLMMVVTQSQRASWSRHTKPNFTFYSSTSARCSFAISSPVQFSDKSHWLLSLFFFYNAYAWHAVMSKPYCGGKHSTWIETTAEEISKLIAPILYMVLVNVSSFHWHCSAKTLYRGLWARTLMSHD